MTRKFLAFDIETATDVPGDDFNWKPFRPLGISCAATFSTEDDLPKLWHGVKRRRDFLDLQSHRVSVTLLCNLWCSLALTRVHAFRQK